jgi:peptidoglycan hydrolase-like protein with peptidoglycan-binding domain
MTTLSTRAANGLFALFFIAAVTVSAGTASAAPLTTQLGLGSTGANVSALQKYLATSPTLYPAGIVSGYYGQLTRTAVMQFQLANNISPVGNVGPMTFAKINQLMANGVTVLDPNAPIIYSSSVSTTQNSASITWSTNENAFGKVHFDVSPIVMYESSAAMTEPQTSGTVVSEQGQFTSHSITLTNLNAGQTYYYSTEVSDPTGNVSVTLPSSFTTL